MLLLLLFLGCFFCLPDGLHASEPKTEEPPPRLLSQDLENKRLGIILGTPKNTFIAALFPGVHTLDFRSTTDMLFSLHAGDLHAAITNEEHMQDIFTQNPVLLLLSDNVFSLPEGPASLSIVFRDNKAARDFGFRKEHTESFRERAVNRFYHNFIEEQRYMLIINGLKVTLLISLLSAILGSLLGGVVCYAHMSKRKTISRIARGFIGFMNVTPLLLLLLILYHFLFSGLNISTLIVAVIALGMQFGSQMAEVFRTSILGVNIGQQEAAIASGFTRFQSFIHIIFPQAFQRIIPIYKTEFINLVKMTAWLGYIGIQDLTHASDIIRSRTYDAFYPLFFAAILYGLIAWAIILIMQRVEISFDPRRKRFNMLKEVAK